MWFNYDAVYRMSNQNAAKMSKLLKFCGRQQNQSLHYDKRTLKQIVFI
uniref:Uncharacterized protein n=1 Tax=Rhizophora mucronata TaxID=61149 RepID=A0A2P2JDR4_RHIMU